MKGPPPKELRDDQFIIHPPKHGAKKQDTLKVMFFAGKDSGPRIWGLGVKGEQLKQHLGVAP